MTTETKADTKPRRDINAERHNLIGQARELLNVLNEKADSLLTGMVNDTPPAGLTKDIAALAKVAKTLGKALNQASIRYVAPAKAPKAKVEKPAPEPKAKTKGKAKAAAETAPE